MGLDQIDVFYRGAAAGKFRMEPGVAEGCAADVQTLIDALEAQRYRAQFDVFSAFGGFDSAQQMQKGFGSKMSQVVTFLDEYVGAAHRLKQSFLIAGRLVDAQEVENTPNVVATENESLISDGGS
ncbi:hypothetical protein [Antrihabitans sp. YC2-6]|uniref:hypothetical protein n=1 Tax=Antrihabitans sp. YC2-6 TaxID=2799498 RepID=UPI0018F6DA21|nr:hypothetical protein [Antrihabitans sp. YC2-6]MBJ8346365.1 hypothetical protein [Antrihabitans sp. YC2-6]